MLKALDHEHKSCLVVIHHWDMASSAIADLRGALPSLDRKAIRRNLYGITSTERAARALCKLDGHPENGEVEGEPLWRNYVPQSVPCWRPSVNRTCT